jgi:hypothetical protein
MIILVGFGGIVAFGFLMQKDKIQATLISTYIALAVTTIWGDQIYRILTGNEVVMNQIWFRANFNPFILKTALFISFLLLLSFKSKVISGKNSKISSPFIAIAYSALAGFLIISSLLSFMPTAQRATILSDSALAGFMYNLRTWWVLLPALMMIFVSATSGSDASESASAAKNTPRVNKYFSRKEYRRRRY